MASVFIGAESRYKDTNVVQVPGVKAPYMELWDRPAELEEMIQNADKYLVKASDVGRLDLIADRYYDDVRLWWVIAAVNNFMDPITDMHSGQQIYIPDSLSVSKMVARRGRVVDEGKGA